MYAVRTHRAKLRKHGDKFSRRRKIRRSGDAATASRSYDVDNATLAAGRPACRRRATVVEEAAIRASERGKRKEKREGGRTLRWGRRGRRQRVQRPGLLYSV